MTQQSDFQARVLKILIAILATTLVLTLGWGAFSLSQSSKTVSVQPTLPPEFHVATEVVFPRTPDSQMSPLTVGPDAETTREAFINRQATRLAQSLGNPSESTSLSSGLRIDVWLAILGLISILLFVASLLLRTRIMKMINTGK
jgi:hypothetical protein